MKTITTKLDCIKDSSQQKLGAKTWLRTFEIAF